MSTVITYMQLKRAHFAIIYNYIGSAAFDGKPKEEKDLILLRLLRLLDFMYHFLSNRHMKPPLFYLFPHENSVIEFTCTKQSSKLQLEGSFHLMMWVKLQLPETEKERGLFCFRNQMGEGIKLQVRQNTIELIVTRSIGSLTGNDDDSITQESYPAQVLQIGEWNYIVMAYEYRKCS